MARTVLAVIAGFIAWLIVLLAIEQNLSAICPQSYSTHKHAFQAAVENVCQLTADTTLLLIQLLLASVVSVISGFLAALIARENKRAPLVLGILLVAFGVLKVALSWQFVPIWHHVILMALLFPMTIMGGKLKA